MKKLLKLLEDEFGTNSFRRTDVLRVARANKISRADIRTFLDSDYKKARGVYSLYEEPPPKQETDQEIFNRIQERFNILGDISEAAMRGKIRALIVSGPPGLGKTHVVTETAERDAENYVVLSGTASCAGLYRALHETQYPGSVCVIDDCDSIFSDINSLNLLKAACDSTKRRMIRWNSEYSFGGDEMEKSFEYHGTIIFITNIDFDASANNPNSKLYPHIQALMSRTHYLSLGIKTRKECLIRIQEVIKSLYRKGEFKKEEALDVVQFIKNNAENLRELSVRTAIKLAQLRATMDSSWEKVARVTMCK